MARKTQMSGVISPRALHIERKVFMSLFAMKDTISEIISGGIRERMVGLTDELHSVMVPY